MNDIVNDKTSRHSICIWTFVLLSLLCSWPALAQTVDETWTFIKEMTENNATVEMAGGVQV